jgi:predicted Zn-dependent protease
MTKKLFKSLATLLFLILFSFPQITWSVSSLEEIEHYKKELLAAQQSGGVAKQAILLSELGFLYYNAQDAVEAEKYFLKAIALSSQVKAQLNQRYFSQLFAYTAQVMFVQGKVNEANSYAHKALALNPQEPTAQRVSHDIASLDNAPDYLSYQNKEVIRWNDNTKIIKVFIPSNQDFKGWSPKNVDIVKAAFHAWETALNNQFTFEFVNSPDQTDVSIFWVNHSVIDDGKEIAGRNKHDTFEQYLVENDIYLSLREPSGMIVESKHLYSTTLHDIGHMLGIHQHSPNVTDIMYTGNAVGQISARDIATLKGIYQLKPDFTNKPGITLSELRRQLNFESSEN